MKSRTARRNVSCRIACSGWVTLAGCLFLASTVAAQTTRFWDAAGGGDFNTNSNWDPPGVPATNDTAVFDLDSAAPYTVTFSDDATHFRTEFRTDRVNLNLSGQTYTVTDTSLVTGWTPTDQKNYGFSVAGNENQVASLTITGQTLSTQTVLVGGSSGSNGSVVLSGTGTLWTNAGTALNSAVLGGNSGTASMTIQNGAVANFGYFTMSRSTNSASFLTITGTGSALNLTHEARIGIGTGTTTGILIENAGRLTTANNFRMDSASVVTVQGANSLLKATGTITVGGAGVDGTTLNLQSGARVESNILVVGGVSGGQMTITGGTTTAQVGNNFDVGLGTTGTLLVSAGASVQAIQFRVGVNAGSIGTATLTGGGTTFSGGTTRIGSSGSGTFEILAGASYSSGITRIAEHAGSTGSVTVDGTNSTFSPTRLSVGGSDGTTNGGTGTLTVRNSGTVNVAGTPASVWVWDDSTLALAGGTFTSGTLTFNEGSTLAVELRAGQFSAPIAVSGALALGTDHATLDITLGSGFLADVDDVFSLVSFGTRTGAFMGLVENDTLSAGAYDFRINYGSGSSDVVTLTVTAIPEPGVLTMLLLAGGLLGLRRRRYRV